MELSSRVANAGLVALVVLDVVLVGVALRSTSAVGVKKTPVSSASASASARAGVPVRPSGSATTAQAGPATPLRTMLVAIDSQRAWRVWAGSCSDGGASATLTTTADGGRTWIKSNTPMRRIVRVKPIDGRAAFLVGADANCAGTLMDTTDGGDTWGSAGSAGGTWFRDPKSATTVRAPGSSTSQPCSKRAVLDLVVRSTASARVLCVDGLVRQTTDTGSSWTDAAQVTGAVALSLGSADPDQTYVARLGAPDCTGVQILRLGQRVATSCVRTAMPEDAGQIALSVVKGGGWLALGDTTLRSTDDLLTWSVS